MANPHPLARYPRLHRARLPPHLASFRSSLFVRGVSCLASGICSHTRAPRDCSQHWSTRSANRDPGSGDLILSGRSGLSSARLPTLNRLEGDSCATRARPPFSLPSPVPHTNPFSPRRSRPQGSPEPLKAPQTTLPWNLSLEAPSIQPPESGPRSGDVNQSRSPNPVAAGSSSHLSCSNAQDPGLDPATSLLNTAQCYSLLHTARIPHVQRHSLGARARRPHHLIAAHHLQH